MKTLIKLLALISVTFATQSFATVADPRVPIQLNCGQLSRESCEQEKFEYLRSRGLATRADYETLQDIKAYRYDEMMRNGSRFGSRCDGRNSFHQDAFMQRRYDMNNPAYSPMYDPRGPVYSGGRYQSQYRDYGNGYPYSRDPAFYQPHRG